MNRAHKLLTILGLVETTWSGTLPAITPTLGSELLTDPGFEAWTTPTDLTNWTETIAGTSTINQESVIVHGDTYAARFDVDGSNSNAQIAQTVIAAVGLWLQLFMWAKTSVVGRSSQILTTNMTLPSGITQALTATYAQLLGTGRVTTANPAVTIRRNSATSSSLYHDDASVKALTLASLLSVRLFQQTNGIFTNHPTRTAFTQAGVVHYADANNMVIAYLDGFGNATIDKCVAGTWSNVQAATAVTYSAGAPLTLQRSGAVGAGVYTLTYNGLAVGVPKSVTDAVFDTARYWGDFSTNSANTFGAHSWQGPH